MPLFWGAAKIVGTLQTTRTTPKLNQTNVGANNNKFYVIQVLKSGLSTFVAWNRWGRVGDEEQMKREDFKDPKKAIAAFEKKFRDKMTNDWV